jgi:hypothetical protein
MKKFTLVLLSMIVLSNFISAYTLKDCYKKYEWQGNPNETYYWFSTPEPALLTFTLNQTAIAPIDDIYGQIYDLKLLSPTNVDWDIFPPYEFYTEGNYVENVYTQVGHAYGAYTDVSDNNIKPAYFYTYFPSLSPVTWSADGNTAYFQYDFVYGAPSELLFTVSLTHLNNLNVGTPLPSLPITMCFMSLLSLPFFRRK